jgi:hypothetical protein
MLPVRRIGRHGVRPERGAEDRRVADLAGQCELLGGDRRRLLRAAERGVCGGRGGAPGRGRGVLDAQRAPARARREQIVQRLGVAALRDPQRAPCLQERQRVDPAGRWLAAGGGRGHGIGLVEPAEARERLDAERGRPGHGERRGGREQGPQGRAQRAARRRALVRRAGRVRPPGPGGGA